ncbi:glycosyltransferase [Desulfonatronospira sp.]|uniref:glycosyltransferase n=1 Tax=Desulfonatronospira sp. TaxID=1962951 RepID=UPI0025B915DC|nr:glycosyltransferase [Desulfonatronospira sp.]
MNILFVCTSKIWGGNEKWCSLAAHELAKAHQVFVVYRSKNVGDRFSVSKKQFFFAGRVDPFGLYRLAKYIRENEIDIVVSTHRKFYMMGALAARLAGSSYFLRCGIVWEIPDSGIYRYFFQNYVHGIIVNARPIREKLLQSGFIDPEKIHLIYNGLDTEKLENSCLEVREKPYPFTVVSSGQLISRKGFDFLIKAFASFIIDHPGVNAGLVIMGEGKLERQLKQLTAELGIQDQVFFTGFLDDPYPLLCTADLFVSASDNEGISNALLEAMYLKIPVITTPAGGAGDIIDHGNNGFLVDHGHKKKLVDLLRLACLEQKNILPEIALAGQQAVLDRFSASDMALAMEKIFDSRHERG